MTTIEIIVIIVSILIVGSVFGSYAYKKIKGQPHSGCKLCSNNMKRTLKKISKELKKEFE